MHVAPGLTVPLNGANDLAVIRLAEHRHLDLVTAADHDGDVAGMARPHERSARRQRHGKVGAIAENPDQDRVWQNGSVARTRRLTTFMCVDLRSVAVLPDSRVVEPRLSEASAHRHVSRSADRSDYSGRRRRAHNNRFTANKLQAAATAAPAGPLDQAPAISQKTIAPNAAPAPNASERPA